MREGDPQGTDRGRGRVLYHVEPPAEESEQGRRKKGGGGGGGGGHVGSVCWVTFSSFLHDSS